ncbi:LysM peptidoglycan-binding domain-containing protein [Paenibacillus sp. J5C_2022]|uniref:LysM peptidoglycan-binding domain-containing protein n=1 Tax=Paenibacillus sp. J5C2022 TaxID=2977129 RepID=UPI0021CF161B|nr:LysM peptidoglycan-binding domain-containing protein [Paenibacillus sp. J5C2022]MCU6711110.1 LysM peptidoglycan-binding domain-containing protein [Paenibacillus sp. J5C2022]
MKIHIVKQGDTLYFIGQKYNVSLEEILHMNPGISNPDALEVGMKIKIPSGHPASGGGMSEMDIMHQHIVKQGDTLWKLSKAWGVPLASMIHANPHLKNPNVLLTGEVINIPKANAQIPATTGQYGAQSTSPKSSFMQGVQGFVGKMSTAPVVGKTLTGLAAGKKNTAPMAEKKPTGPIVSPVPPAKPEAKVEPEAKKVEPLATKKEPEAKKVEPLATKMEPEAKKVEPLATKMEPEAKKVEPLAKKMEPEAKKVEPLASKVMPESTKVEAQSAKVMPQSKKMEPLGSNIGPSGGNMQPLSNMGPSGGNMQPLSNMGPSGGNMQPLSNMGPSGGNMQPLSNMGPSGGNMQPLGNMGPSGGNMQPLSNMGPSGGNMQPMSNVAPYSAENAGKVSPYSGKGKGKELPLQQQSAQEVNPVNSEYMQSMNLFQQYQAPAYDMMQYDYPSSPNENMYMPMGKGEVDATAYGLKEKATISPYGDMGGYDCPPGMGYPMQPALMPYGAGPGWGYGNPMVNVMQQGGNMANPGMMPMANASNAGMISPLSNASNAGMVSPLSNASNAGMVSPLSNASNAGMISPLSNASNAGMVSPLSNASNAGMISPLSNASNAGMISPLSNASNAGAISQLSAMYPQGFQGFSNAYPTEGYPPYPPMWSYSGEADQEQSAQTNAKGDCGCGGERKEDAEELDGLPGSVTPVKKKTRKKTKKAVIRTIAPKPKRRTTYGSRPWLNH